MIESVEVQNFRCLKSVQVALRPLTVLVGPNDSGKTTFLEALLCGLGAKPLASEDSGRDGEAPGVVAYGHRNARIRTSAALIRLPSEGVPMKSTGVVDPTNAAAPNLEPAGTSLATLMDYLLRRDRKRFETIQATLRDLVPGFEEIRISVPEPAERWLSWLIDGGLEIPGERLSTGARIMFFFVALAHHPSPPDVLLIEEPENGVHPRRLREVVELLRTLSQGKAGTAKQVILTTHSPYLLDQIRLPEDQVIVFQRQDDGSRTAREVDSAGLKSFLDEFMLGEVWFNQGEEGLLAKAR